MRTAPNTGAADPEDEFKEKRWGCRPARVSVVDVGLLVPQRRAQSLSL